MSEKAIYLLSDLHLGAPDHTSSLVREKHVIRFLEKIADCAAEIYLLGDVFDFWFEYRHAVPKGFVRFMGQLARLRDAGIPIHLFTGNHDLWHQNYLREQVGVELYRKPVERQFFGQTYYLAHGDGLGPGDQGYKLMKRIMTHPLSRWLFARLHPNFGIGLAYWLSHNGGDHDYQAERLSGYHYDARQDPLWTHAQELIAAKHPADHFVFGHRHQLVNEEIAPGQRFFILGDWIHFFSYLKITPEGPALLRYPLPQPTEIEAS